MYIRCVMLAVIATSSLVVFGCGSVLTRVDAGNTDYRIAAIGNGIRIDDFQEGFAELCAVSTADHALPPPINLDPAARLAPGVDRAPVGAEGPGLRRRGYPGQMYDLIDALWAGGGYRTPQGRAVIRLLPLRSPYAARSDLQWEDSLIASRADSTVRVSLKQAYVNNFSEGYFDKRGEVAVLATVREGGGGWVGTGARNGRIVYFGEGVREQTFLNFRDQPVYGPIGYNGGDIHARISLIEVDFGDNERNRQMLRTAAHLGQSVYPPASPVLAALEQLGGSLIEANGDDIDLDYVLRLSSTNYGPTAGSDDQQAAFQSGARDHIDAWLAEGYYVFVRTKTNERRLTEADWASLRLDPTTGVLYRLTSQFERIPLSSEEVDKPARSFPLPLVTEFTEASYLVLAVQNGFDATEQNLKQEVAELDQLVQARTSNGNPVDLKDLQDQIGVIRKQFSD